MKFTASMRANHWLAFISMTLGFSLGLNAQFTTLSPYSRFGLGELYQTGNMGTLSLGGLRSTYNDPFMVNSENPATLGSLINTSLQTGIRLNALRLSQGDQEQQMNSGNLDQFQMAFKRPSSKWGVVLGMVPFSLTGYAITRETTLPDIGQVSYNYEGNGGITKAFVGYGRRFDVMKTHYFLDPEGVAYDSTKVRKHSLSLGSNLAYYFGNLTQTRLVEIQNTTFLGTRARRFFRMNDLSADFGLHYEVLLKGKFGKDKKMTERWLLQLGLVYSPELEMKTSTEEYYESVLIQQSSVFPVDTSFAFVGEGNSLFPQRISAGFALHRYDKKGRHLMIGLDIDQRDWSLFQTAIGDETSNPGLSKSTTLSLGLQFTPRAIDEGKNLLERTQYRVGLRSQEGYLNLNGGSMRDQALSAGISIPLLSSRSASKLHFGMEFGTRGGDEAFFIREDYVNVFFGVTLSPFIKNAWFVERKYD